MNAPRLETAIGRILRVGVVTSSTCLGAGLMLEATGAAAASRVLLNVGLVILMATPVGRVVVSVAEYALERDWVFVALTMIVLLELMASLAAAWR